MKKLFLVLLLLVTGLFTACENPFEEVKNDLDAIQAMQDVQDKVAQIETLLAQASFDAGDIESVKALLVSMSGDVDTILESDAAVSVLREEYDGDVKADVEAFKNSANYADYEASVDDASKLLVDNIVNKLIQAGF